MEGNNQQAFVLRVAPSFKDKVPEALSENQIIIGWAEANGLLNPSLTWEQFRGIISSVYYSSESTMRKAGGASGNMWRFIREMRENDYVVVPHGSEFYVAQVKGPATYNKNLIPDDTAYRREVLWLNDKSPIPRIIAKAALVSRMKSQGTCTYATDLIEEIQDSLENSAHGSNPTFQSDLQLRLIRETLEELRKGRIDSFIFERLIQSVMMGLGAEEARIVPRSQDKGADILATFRVAGTIQQVIAIQAKHWQPDPPVSVDVIEQLIRGIEAESADLGLVVTSGAISDEASKAAAEYYEDKGINIELVDGEQFAKLIVEHGIRVY